MNLACGRLSRGRVSPCCRNELTSSVVSDVEGHSIDRHFRCVPTSGEWSPHVESQVFIVLSVKIAGCIRERRLFAILINIITQSTMPGTQSAILWQIRFQITMPGTQSAILWQIQFQITMPGTQSAILRQIRFQITMPGTQSAILWQIRFQITIP